MSHINWPTRVCFGQGHINHPLLSPKENSALLHSDAVGLEAAEPRQGHGLLLVRFNR